MENILLTGYPRVGKTTTIRKIIEQIPIEKAGFFTEELRDELGKRIGFKITTIGEGKEGLLSHVDKPSKYLVGKYYVQLEEFEEIVLPELSKKTELMVIDEIGKMELFSEKFRVAVEKCLNQGNVLASITMKGGGVFIEKIKRRKDIELIKLTIENRDEYANKLIQKIMKEKIGVEKKENESIGYQQEKKRN